MATTNLKRITANILAEHLADNITGLAGLVSAVAAGPNEDLTCLAVKIIPSTFIFEPSNADEVYYVASTEPDDGSVILDVGSWVGIFTIELYTTSPAEREQYEQAIIDLFLATEWAPGTLFLDTPALTVMGYVSLYEAEIKFRLQEESWVDEMSFESKRYTFLEVFVDFPALVSAEAARIEDLQLALSLDTEEEIVDMTDIEDVYQIQVQEDGSTLPVSDPA